jgi:hypothetical protein
MGTALPHLGQELLLRQRIDLAGESCACVHDEGPQLLAAGHAADVQPIIGAFVHMLLYTRVGDCTAAAAATVACHAPTAALTSPVQHVVTAAAGRTIVVVALFHGPVGVVHSDPLGGWQPEPDLLARCALLKSLLAVVLARTLLANLQGPRQAGCYTSWLLVTGLLSKDSPWQPRL